MKRELERVEIPGEHEARERTWRLLSAAFEEREPIARSRARRLLPAVALACVGAVVAAGFSSPGRALLHSIRETVGVRKAQPALFSLPARGRLLVASGGGTWVVDTDGSKRRLGAYREASWSPFGRFVVATRRNALYALTPKGEERWSLARPDVQFPRWAGTRADTRIAYLTTSRLHVVGGDGKGDVDALGLPAAARVAPAWRPGAGFELASADTHGRVYLIERAGNALAWRSAPFPEPRLLAWSDDGRRLLLVTRDKLVVFGERSGRPLAVRFLEGAVGAAFRPHSHRIAVVRAGDVLLLDADRLRAQPGRVFGGAGSLSSLAWSPDGRWLLVGWPAADQLVFLRVGASGPGRIRAVANVSAQFRSRSFPRVEGWCCPR